MTDPQDALEDRCPWCHEDIEEEDEWTLIDGSFYHVSCVEDWRAGKPKPCD